MAAPASSRRRLYAVGGQVVAALTTSVVALLVAGLLSGWLMTALSSSSNLADPMQHQSVASYSVGTALVLGSYLILRLRALGREPVTFAELAHRVDQIMARPLVAARIAIAVGPVLITLLAGLLPFIMFWFLESALLVVDGFELRARRGFRLYLTLNTAEESADERSLSPFQRGYLESTRWGVVVPGFFGAVLSMGLLLFSAQSEALLTVLAVGGLIAAFRYAFSRSGRGEGLKRQLILGGASLPIAVSIVMFYVGVRREEWVWILIGLAAIAVISTWMLHVRFMVPESQLQTQVLKFPLPMGRLARAASERGLHLRAEVPTTVAKEQTVRLQPLVVGTTLVAFVVYAYLSAVRLSAAALSQLFGATLGLFGVALAIFAAMTRLGTKRVGSGPAAPAKDDKLIDWTAGGLVIMAAAGSLSSLASLLVNLAVSSDGVSFGAEAFQPSLRAGLLNRLLLFFNLAMVVNLFVSLSELFSRFRDA